MNIWKKYLGFPETQGTYGFLLVFIIDAFGSGLFLPLSILYFQVAAGFPLLIIGLILTIATVCTLPMTLVAGSLVDRFGARRVTASSQLVLALGLLGYLFVHEVPVLFLMALLVTAGTRMFYAAHTALIAEMATPYERDRWYGLAGAIRNGGIGMGGFLTGLFLTMGDPTIYRLLIGICFVCYLVAGCLLLSQSDPGQPGQRGIEPAPKTLFLYKLVLQDHLFLCFLISNLSFPLCIIMLGTALPIYVTEAVHAPAWIISWSLVLNSLLIIGCQTLVVRLVEPHRRTRAIGAAALVWCGACSLFALSLLVPRPILIPYLLLVVSLYTLASLLYTPVASALVADLGPTALRGRYLATYEFSWGAANALLPALFTALYTVTPALPWIVLAVLAPTSGMGVFLLERKFPARAIRAVRQKI